VTHTAPRHIILGTAGHIDHGKTTLVKALTGIDTDRLKEEKERGITIELGFAFLDLPPWRFGVVDVPGHERFVKTMVAGAAGIDLVMLVIAADEGVMPQTREHLDICGLLGVRRGLVALTKRDLVEPDWLALVTEDVRARLFGSFLEGAAIIPVSATSGAGLAELRAEITRLAPEVPGKDPEGLVRLPLDRVFTMHGFGTVVTGTLAAGRLREGDDVVVLPGGGSGKVRGLQVHGEPRPEALAGQRVAANLQGAPREAIARGEVLVRPGTLEATSIVDVELRYLRVNRTPLPRRSKLLFHSGTTQAMASSLLLDRNELEPGKSALVQLHLESPVVVLPGDHFIARGFSPLEDYGTTFGGGTIVRVHSPRLRRASEEIVSRLQAMASAQLDERVALELAAAGTRGLALAELQMRLGATPRQVEGALTRLLSARRAVRYDQERGAVIHADELARLRALLVEHLTTFHRDNPLREGIAREELRSKLPGDVGARLLHVVLEPLVKDGTLIADRELVRSASHRTAARAEDLRERVLAVYRQARLAPPRTQDVAGGLAAPARDVSDVVALLLREGALVRVSSELLFAREAVDDLRSRLEAHLQEHGQIDAQQFKDLVGQSRKFAIPLAEYFDAQKVTMRVGEIRRLRGR
jgi:selenocysteine-specific elongation factor